MLFKPYSYTERYGMRLQRLTLDGFTLDVRKMTEPREGISVAYWATQDSHGRQALDAVVRHATEHDGFVGGWLDPSDSLYYFDSVRLFPEDSLEAAVIFGKANFQKAIYKLSTGEEIILKEDVSSSRLNPDWKSADVVGGHLGPIPQNLVRAFGLSHNSR